MKHIRAIRHGQSIRVRFTYGGNRYGFCTGGRWGDRIDMAFAAAICARIELDIKAGFFDATLARYLGGGVVPGKRPCKPRKLLKVWDGWVAALNLSAETRADHYEMVRRMIAIAKPAPTIDSAAWFVKSGSALAPSTFNKRLGYLRRCCKWSMLRGYVAANPYDDVKALKVVKVAVKPFTALEIQQIMECFRGLHPSYAPFVGFMLMTGARTAEAIGLQWRRVDFNKGEVTIADSLPKQRGSKGRQRKDTKTGTVTVLTMSDGLRELLQSIDRGAPDDLVFRSPKGSHIDSGNFRAAWIEVLAHCNIEYRKPYATRHTAASHAIDQGATLPAVAYILGHKDTRMVAQTYGHVVDRPELPDIKIS
jgi:integrase